MLCCFCLYIYNSLRKALLCLLHHNNARKWDDGQSSKLLLNFTKFISGTDSYLVDTGLGHDLQKNQIEKGATASGAPPMGDNTSSCSLLIGTRTSDDLKGLI
ncbi:hypothetical protein Ancab_026873 [Ancistrocladus abbreviatus]